MRMPVDMMKLDRCFVSSPEEEPASLAIAQAVVHLGDVLQLETVAEGIETAEQADRMKALGYSYGQGYYFGRPVPAEQMQTLLLAPASEVLSPS